MPGGYIPTLETKQRECWKFETRDVNSEFESRVSVQPSNIPAATLAWFIVLAARRTGNNMPTKKRGLSFGGASWLSCCPVPNKPSQQTKRQPTMSDVSLFVFCLFGLLLREDSMGRRVHL